MRKNYLVVIILAILLCPLKIYAYEIYCSQTDLKFEDEFSCYFIGAEDIVEVEFDVFKGKLESTDNLKCEFSMISGMMVSADENNNDKTILNQIGYTPTSVIGEITCNVIKNESKSDSQIFINNFEYHKKDDPAQNSLETVSSDYLNVKSKASAAAEEKETKPRATTNADTRLKSIKDPNLDFTFSQFVTIYKIEVLNEVETLNLEIETNNPNATYRVEGDMNLKENKTNVIDIYVTSPDGLSLTCYTLEVKRLPEGQEVYKEESDASLKSLKVEGFNIAFKQDQKEYKIHLKDDETSIKVEAIPNSSVAIINISNTSNLKNGSVVSVNITSGDKTSSNLYKIIITKDKKKKDYSQIIIIVVTTIGLIGALTLFILTSQKKKQSDPLLSIKLNKRKINRGKKFDDSQVSIIDTPNNNLETNEVSNNTNQEFLQNQTAVPAAQTEQLNNQVPVAQTTQVQSAEVVQNTQQVTQNPQNPPAQQQMPQVQPVVNQSPTENQINNN